MHGETENRKARLRDSYSRFVSSEAMALCRLTYISNVINQLYMVRGHIFKERIESTHDETRRKKAKLRTFTDEANALDFILYLQNHIRTQSGSTRTARC